MLYEEKDEEPREDGDLLGEENDSETESDAIGSGDSVGDTDNTVESDELSPLECFLMKSDSSEKWIMRLAKMWHYAISILWFVIGALTFAPVIYLSHKMNLVLKNKKKSIIGGLILYAVIIAIVAILLMR